MDRSTGGNQQEPRCSRASNENARLCVVSAELHEHPSQLTVSSIDSDPCALHDSSRGTNPPSPVSSRSSSVLKVQGGISRSPVPYVLAPRIDVIPESRAIDDGSRALWAAVEISTQLCQATGTGEYRQDPERFHTGKRYITPISSYC